MNFYTNVALRKDHILVREWDNGKRVTKRVPYKPYLFINSKAVTGYKTIHGQNVERREFPNVTEAREFLHRYKDTAGFDIYGMEKFVYPYIYDHYKDPAYDTQAIIVGNIDIEVAADEGFPDIKEADKPINAITVESKDIFYVFSTCPYDNKDPATIKFFPCKDEIDLIKQFLDFWERLDPDAMTGWNIEFFDIPYLVNRIMRLLGADWAKKLSPWGLLQKRKVEIRGREQEVWLPIGVAILDYIRLYKKFVPVQRESYALDYIAWLELKEKKLSYTEEGSIYALYKTNPQKFIDYNIHDTRLVKKLDHELNLLGLVFAIAYDARVNYEDAVGAVLLWDVICTNYLMDQKKVVPRTKIGERTLIKGAHVKCPQIGMHNWVVSFDLTSLYPMLIQQYNISPDTFAGNMKKQWSIDDFVFGRFDQTDWLVKNNVSLAANLCMYKNDKRGFLPELMEQQFKLRKQYKDKMLELKREQEAHPEKDLKAQITTYKTFQESKKIQLNSLYGVLSNPYFRWYNIGNAEAVTYSGQAVIRRVEDKVNKYLNKVLETKDEDYVIASDTDSIFLNLNAIVKKLYPGAVDKKKAIDALDRFGQEKLVPLMNKTFEKYAEETHAYANMMFMKREAIGDKAIWQATKRYIINMYDEEGVRFAEPKMKIKGIEAIRSSTPELCRDKIKEAIKIIMNKDEDALIDFIDEFRADFKTRKFEEIASPRTVNGISFYHDEAMLFKKGTPIQVKASIVYNDLLKQKGLVGKYPPIYDKDKIKWCYMFEQNPTPDVVIAAPKELPEELDLHRFLNYDMQFVKVFLEPLKGILSAIGWRYEKEENLEAFYA